jgi:hypothetical protein
MQTLEYRFVDKSTWGEGQWQDEPDKKQWADTATGLPCLIVRGPSGALCGYVGIAEGHPWHGVSYSHYSDCDGASSSSYEASPEAIINVHGGLTFSDFCADGEPVHGICHRPDAGETDHVWWFGFDCAHYLDETPRINARLRSLGDGDLLAGSRDVYRDIAYVQSECADLARQLVAVSALAKTEA